MPNILFISCAPTHFSMLWPYAQILKRDFTVQFFIDNRFNHLNKETAILESEGVGYYLNTKNSGYNFASHYTFLQKALYRFLDFISAKRFKYALFDLINDKIIVKSFLNKNKFDIVVSGEDNVGIKTVFNHLKKKFNYTTVVMPFTVANHEEQGAAFYKMKEFHISSLSRKIKFMFVGKKWKLRYKDKLLTREHLPHIFAYKFLGISPPNPFLPVGGKSDIVFFESDFVKDYYLNSGLSNKKYSIVPSPGFKFFKDKTQHGNNIQDAFPGKKIVLCSLPPDFLPNDFYGNYNEMVHSWCKVLTAPPGVKAFISLHPRTKIEDVAFIKEYGITVLEQPITNFMASADVFVACISATIRFALTCKKTVLNYDMFSYNYTEYSAVPSVITVTTPDQFETQYHKIITGSYNHEKYYNEHEGYFGDTSGDPDLKIIKAFTELC